MMLAYERYAELGGTLEDSEFDSLFPVSCEFIQMYAEKFIAESKLRDNFDDYGLDLDKAIVQQIDFVHSIGESNAFYAQSDLNLKSVTTSGFTYTYDNSQKDDIEYIDGIPLSPLAKMTVKNQLRRKGYLRRWVYDK